MIDFIVLVRLLLKI